MTELRHSGHDWLGFVPSHWITRPLWSMYRRVKDVEHPEEQMLSVFRERGVVVKEEYENLNKTAENRNIYQLVHPGWLVVNRMKAWQGSVGISGHRGIVSGHYICFSPIHSEDRRYLNWLLRSDAYRDAYFRLSRGVRIGQAEIDNDSLRQLPVLLPPPEEQRDISDFLDRETAQIDALIEAQRELVDRLHERRLAVIQSLVLHGAGDGPNLVDSGVRWIGEVPKHWQVGCIRRFAQMHSGHTPSRQVADYWVNCNIPWFTLADVWQLRPGRQEYLGQTAEQVSELGLANSAAELLPAGTVVFSRTASVGFSGIMPVAMATSQDFWNWVCGSELLPEYLLYVFRAMKTEFEALRMGSTHQTIYEGDAAAIHIPVPPTSEQREIVGLVRHSVARTDDMIDAASNTVALLQERRSALISAAVTGRIDPRTGKETVPEKVLEFA